MRQSAVRSDHAEIAAHVLDAIDREAAAAGLRECCGALVGTVRGGITRVVAFEPLENAAVAADRSYEVRADDVLRVQRHWEDQGFDVVGFYHSHPTAEAVPSATDAMHAVPGYLYMIAGERVRGWRTEAAGEPFTEIRLRSVTRG